MESQKQRQHRLAYIGNNAVPLEEHIDYENKSIELCAYDIAGNLVKLEKPESIYEAIQRKRQEEAVKYIATMKDVMSMEEFEGLISKCGIIKRSPSPCPCKSKECEEEYKKDIVAYSDLLKAKAKGEK